MSKVVETITEAAKAVPPAGVIGVSIAGIPVSEWVVIGSGLLIVLQIFFLIRKEIYLPWKDKRNGR